MTTRLDVILRDNPATDARGTERLAMPYLLVGAHPQAQAASRAELYRADGRPGRAQ